MLNTKINSLDDRLKQLDNNMDFLPEHLNNSVRKRKQFVDAYNPLTPNVFNHNLSNLTQNSQSMILL